MADSRELEKTKWFVEQVNKLTDSGKYKNKTKVAEALDITMSYMSRLYGGIVPVTEVVETRMKELSKTAFRNESPAQIENEHRIPYYDITATAGDVDVFTDTQYATDYITMPQFNDCDIALNVWGDSMEPEYKSGTIIFCKRIADFAVIDFGHAHLIVTAEQNLLKILQPDEKDDSIWILESLNTKYRPFKIPKDKVTNLFKVKGKANQTAM